MRLLAPALVVALVFFAATSASADTSFLDRPDNDELRVMSYNPYWNSIFPTGGQRYRKADEFERVITAIRPDVVCLQEIGPDHDATELVAIFDAALPLDSGSWSVAAGPSCVVVTRHPIARTHSEVTSARGSDSRGHVIALVVPDDGSLPGGVLVVSAHFVSGGSDAQIAARSVQAIRLVEAVRRTVGELVSGGPIPVVLAGDFNAYQTDPRRHLAILMTGDTAHPDTTRSLDPSGAPLIDLLPVHNGTGSDTWTWRDDTQEFAPYALDRILYAGSSIVAVHSFVLNTAILSPDGLSAVGLEAGDVVLDLHSGNYDHLPLVADIRGVRR
jgi:endonuclease/exonuclease/phosphatase family metal-dependent hydrolase